MTCGGSNVLGYYSLSAGAIAREAAPKPMQRNLPDPLPVLLLGRLAVDRRLHNQGLSSALLRDAMLRSFNISRQAGVVAMLIHALHDQARQFYLSRGFIPSPLQPMTLMVTVPTIQTILVETNQVSQAGQSGQVVS